MASQITSLTIVHSTVQQSSASLAFVRGIHWSPVNSPHNGPVTRKMFPFDDVIMILSNIRTVIRYLYNKHPMFALVIPSAPGDLYHLFNFILENCFIDTRKIVPQCLWTIPLLWSTRGGCGGVNDLYQTTVGHIPCTYASGSTLCYNTIQPNDYAITWKHFLHYWPFVRGFHRWPGAQSDCKRSFGRVISCLNRHGVYVTSL